MVLALVLAVALAPVLVAAMATALVLRPALAPALAMDLALDLAMARVLVIAMAMEMATATATGARIAMTSAERSIPVVTLDELDEALQASIKSHDAYYGSALEAALGVCDKLAAEIRRLKEALVEIADSECPDYCKSCELQCLACIAKDALAGR